MEALESKIMSIIDGKDEHKIKAQRLIELLEEVAVKIANTHLGNKGNKHRTREEARQHEDTKWETMLDLAKKLMTEETKNQIKEQMLEINGYRAWLQGKYGINIPETKEEWQTWLDDKTKHTQIFETAREDKLPHTSDPQTQTKEAENTRWENMIEAARNLTTTPDTSKTEAELRRHAKWLEVKYGINMPKTKHEWQAWANTHQEQKANFIHRRENLHSTDWWAARNKKAFYKLVLKDFESTRTSSLITEKGIVISDPTKIEAEFVKYLHILGDQGKEIQTEEELADEAKTRGWKTHQALADGKLLRDPTNQEVKEAITGTGDVTALGHLSPALLKTICLTKWANKKTFTEDEENLLNAIQEIKSTRREIWETHIKEGVKDTENYTTEIGIPRQVLRILKNIVSLSLKSLDLPSSQKHGIITGLPKKAGQVNSIYTIRPITVSPIIGRLINKILATRLAHALDQHDIIDPAQHAFLKAKSIHEPISTIIKVFEHAREKRTKSKKIKKKKKHTNNTPTTTANKEKDAEKRQTENSKRDERAKRRKQTHSTQEQIPEKSIPNRKQEEQEQTTAPEDNETGAVYALYYDISKAYDCMKWSSLRRALTRIGVGEKFIQYTMNSLKNTKVAMKTDQPGWITPEVKFHKAVKQGCPLAPLLFAIVMDELHAGYREIGGYELKNGNQTTTVSSRGYCDDTAIVAKDIGTLKKMNQWTQKFFDTHGFNVSLRKTYFVGIEADGTNTRHNVQWNGENIKQKPGNEGIRYLGCHIATNLDWTTHIGKMNVAIMSLLSDIKYKTLTLLQSCMLIKEVITPTLEIGLRHATIPISQLKKWDDWIYKAIRKRSEILENSKIHKSAISTILRAPPIQDAYAIAKTTQIMECLTKKSELQGYYKHQFQQATGKLYKEEKIQNSTNNDIQITFKQKNPKRQKGDTEMLTALRVLAQSGIAVKRNKDAIMDKERYTKETEAIKSQQTERLCAFEDVIIPMRETDRLWGRNYTPKNIQGEEITPTEARVVVCTDGSTFMDDPTKPHSGSAVVYMIDGSDQREALCPAQYWLICEKDNFAAEMAAINRAIRSIPANIPITIHTDSQSSITAIKEALRLPRHGSHMRVAARPHTIAVCRAIKHRDDLGAQTQLLHVHSHTGKRTIPALGNQQADTWAKEAVIGKMTEEDHETLRRGYKTMLQNEMQYIVYTGEEPQKDNEQDEHTSILSPIHGDIRQKVKHHLGDLRIGQWGDPEQRPRSGELIRTDKRAVLKIIRKLWEDPTSSAITTIMRILTQADVSWPRPKCPHCNLNCEDTVAHILMCPTYNEILNEVDDKIAKILEYEDLEEEELECYLRDDIKNAITRRTYKIGTREKSNCIKVSTGQGEETTTINQRNQANNALLNSIRQIGQGGEPTGTTTHRQETTEDKLIRKYTRKDLTPQKILRIQNPPKPEDKYARPEIWDKLTEGMHIAIIGEKKKSKTITPWIARIVNKTENNITIQWWREQGSRKTKWMVEDTSELTKVDVGIAHSILKIVEGKLSTTKTGRKELLTTTVEEWETILRTYRITLNTDKHQQWITTKRKSSTKTKEKTQTETTQETTTEGKRTTDREGHHYRKNYAFAPVAYNQKTLISRGNYEANQTITGINSQIWWRPKGIPETETQNLTSNTHLQIMRTKEGELRIYPNTNLTPNKGMGHLCQKARPKEPHNAQIEWDFNNANPRQLDIWIRTTKPIKTNNEITLQNAPPNETNQPTNTKLIKIQTIIQDYATERKTNPTDHPTQTEIKWEQLLEIHEKRKKKQDTPEGQQTQSMPMQERTKKNQNDKNKKSLTPDNLKGYTHKPDDPFAPITHQRNGLWTKMAYRKGQEITEINSYLGWIPKEELKSHKGDNHISITDTDKGELRAYPTTQKIKDYGIGHLCRRGNPKENHNAEIKWGFDEERPEQIHIWLQTREEIKPHTELILPANPQTQNEQNDKTKVPLQNTQKEGEANTKLHWTQTHIKEPTGKRKRNTPDQTKTTLTDHRNQTTQGNKKNTKDHNMTQPHILDLLNTRGTKRKQTGQTTPNNEEDTITEREETNIQEPQGDPENLRKTTHKKKKKKTPKDKQHIRRGRSGGLKQVETGDNPEHGHLYSKETDQTTPIELRKATWISKDSRGVYVTNKPIQPNTKITPYAGIITWIWGNEAIEEETTHMRSILPGMAIKGLEEPKQGYGLGSFINHTDDPKKVNVTFKASQRGVEKEVYVLSTKVIGVDQELLTNYGKDYWKRMEDAKQNTHNKEIHKKIDNTPLTKGQEIYWADPTSEGMYEATIVNPKPDKEGLITVNFTECNNPHENQRVERQHITRIGPDIPPPRQIIYREEKELQTQTNRPKPDKTTRKDTKWTWQKLREAAGEGLETHQYLLDFQTESASEYITNIKRTTQRGNKEIKWGGEPEIIILPKVIPQLNNIRVWRKIPGQPYKINQVNIEETPTNTETGCTANIIFEHNNQENKRGERDHYNILWTIPPPKGKQDLDEDILQDAEGQYYRKERVTADGHCFFHCLEKILQNHTNKTTQTREETKINKPKKRRRIKQTKSNTGGGPGEPGPQKKKILTRKEYIKRHLQINIPPALLKTAQALTTGTGDQNFIGLTPCLPNNGSHATNMMIQEYMRILQSECHIQNKAIWILPPQNQGHTQEAKSMTRMFRRYRRSLTPEMKEDIHNIEDLDKIIIPIRMGKMNETGHFVLMIINLPKEHQTLTVEMLDSMKNLGSSLETTAFDLTLAIMNRDIADENLIQEAYENWCSNYQIHNNEPQQHNNDDCAIYVCTQAAWRAITNKPAKRLPMHTEGQAAEQRMALALDIHKSEINHTKMWETNRWKQAEQEEDKTQEEETNSDEEIIVDLTKDKTKDENKYQTHHKRRKKIHNTTHRQEPRIIMLPNKAVREWRERTKNLVPNTKTQETQEQAEDTQEKRNTNKEQKEQIKINLNQIENTLAINHLKNETNATEIKLGKHHQTITNLIKTQLHIQNIIGDNPLNNHRGTLNWWSSDQTNKNLGAQTPPNVTKVEFMKNKYTWVEPTQKEKILKPIIQAAIRATGKTTTPTSIITIVRDYDWKQTIRNTTLHKNTKLQKPLRNEDKPLEQGDTKITQIARLTIREQESSIMVRIIAIHNTAAKPKKMTYMIERLNALENITAEDTNEQETTEENQKQTKRYPPDLRPSLQWIRTDTPTNNKSWFNKEDPSDIDRAHDTMTKHNKILGRLGIHPKGIRKSLKAMGHNEPTQEQMQEISNILWNSTMKIFEKNHKWVLENKKQLNRNSKEGIT